MNEFKLNQVFNWQLLSKKISPSLPYAQYVADLYQAGTDAPVATELFNNTGATFSYDYLAPGAYLVQSSKELFSGCTWNCPPGQKTQTNITNAFYCYDIITPNGFSITIFVVSPTAMIILSSDLGGSETNDIIGHFVQNSLEITIYP